MFTHDDFLKDWIKLKKYLSIGIKLTFYITSVYYSYAYGVKRGEITTMDYVMEQLSHPKSTPGAGTPNSF